MRIGESRVFSKLEVIFFLTVSLVFGFYIKFIVSNIDLFYVYNPMRNEAYVDFTTGIGLAFLLFVIMFLAPVKRKLFWLFLWMIKVFVIFSIFLFYEKHYSILDAYTYMELAPNASCFSFSPLNATGNIISLTNCFYSLFASYRACLVFFSFIGLWGMIFFFKSLNLVFERLTLWEMLVLFCFPSMIFWTSILGKDPVVFFIEGLYFHWLCRFLVKHRLFYLFLSLITLFSFVYFRFWLLAIWGVSLFLSILCLKVPTFQRISGVIIGAITVFVGWVIVFRYFGVNNLQDIINLISRLSQAWAHGGSAQLVYIGSWFDYIKFLPIATFSALFRPLPFEAKNMFQLASGMENLILFFLFFRALIVYLKSKYRKFLNVLLIHIVMWVLVYAPISYQNLGTAVRYKLQVLPFMLAFVIAVNRIDKVRAGDVKCERYM